MDFKRLPVGFFQDNNPNVAATRKLLVKNISKININDISNLETSFYSDENIDLINKQIVLTVFKKTNKQYRINFQSKDKIIIIMQYVFNEYARHLPYDIKDQIKELNCIVVGEIIPNLITNFEQKLGYLKDIEKRGELVPLPVSSTADRTLPTANLSFFH